MAPLIELRALTVELPTPAGWIRPVDDVSFTLETGESLGLVGESGSGKSMLALALMGLLPPGAKVSGEAWLAGANNAASSSVNLLGLSERERVATRGRDVAMIFQEPMTALNPVMRVGAQIAEAIRAHTAGLANSEVDSRVLAALDRAAVPEPALRAQQYPHQLSGGLRQRAMIAMALAAGAGSTWSPPERDAGSPPAARLPDGQGRAGTWSPPEKGAGSTWSPPETGSRRPDGVSHSAPRLLIADEPTTALDVTVQKQILDLLARLRRDLGLTLLFITHDLGVVAQVADRIAVAYAGRIVEEGPAREVLENPRHPYTAGLLRASPKLVRHKLEPIPGAVPSLTSLPSGCAFEPRCGLRRVECTAAMPELRNAGPEHRARCILVQNVFEETIR
jgi:oligopeptide/dipeptide ABC transporter ATP-binding protein